MKKHKLLKMLSTNTNIIVHSPSIIYLTTMSFVNKNCNLFYLCCIQNSCKVIMSEKIWGSYPDQYPRSQLIWNMRCFVMKLKSHDHKFDSELVLAPAQCNISQHSDVCWNDLIRILSLNLIRCFSELSFYEMIIINEGIWY